MSYLYTVVQTLHFQSLLASSGLLDRTSPTSLGFEVFLFRHCVQTRDENSVPFSVGSYKKRNPAEVKPKIAKKCVYAREIL